MASKKISPNLARFLRYRREMLTDPVTHKGMTQDDVAKELTRLGFKYAYSSVAHWENEEHPVAPPLNKPEFVRALASVLRTMPFHIYEAAGWLEGSELPVDQHYARIVKLLEKAGPKRRKIIEQVIETMITAEDIDEVETVA